jgi:hypothetical protein
MNWNATNSKRILGDVPVEADGSASFTVPADKYIYFQALDAEKLMLQSMRSGTTVLPGEVQGCVGCHEDRQSVPHVRAVPLALGRPPSRIEPWYGPARDFSFAREVQPVFDRYCVSCHDRGKPAGEKLILAGDLGLAFNASYVDLRRRSPLRWFPEAAGEPKALVKAVDDGPPEVLPPYAWGAHRSRLIDVVKGGHEDVQLDRESFERIATWIDMNAPYYGDYSTAYGSNAFGRSPLDGGELHRLRELTGRPLGDVQSELAGSPVSFTRPEWSPVLEGLEVRDPGKYAEALALIRAGIDRLARSPRADMPGVALSGEDARRQAKYEACQKEESEGRRLVREGGAPE